MIILFLCALRRSQKVEMALFLTLNNSFSRLVPSYCIVASQNLILPHNHAENRHTPQIPHLPLSDQQLLFLVPSFVPLFQLIFFEVLLIYVQSNPGTLQGF